MAAPSNSLSDGPCPHCGSTFHFPERCPFRAGAPSNSSTRQLPYNTGTHLIAPLIPHPITPPPMQKAPSPISPQLSCARTTTAAFAQEPNADSARRARDAEDHTQGILVPSHLWGRQLPTPDNWGTCTPLGPLVLECELCNHPDKAFVQQLISDLTHGYNI